jgi:hypothetical protein
MRTILSLSALALLTTIATAEAGGRCGSKCYERVHQPPTYGTIAETVEVAPARSYARHVPPVYGTVHEKIVVRPEHIVARVIPGQYQIVAETVEVVPARKVWKVIRDGWGREIGCWVSEPAQFATRHRHVQVSPERVVHDTVPAVYGTRERTALVKPGYVSHEHVPAQYGVRHRVVQTSPGYDGWQPIRKY